MSIPTPGITARLDALGKSYALVDWEIEMERQRPTYAELYATEPVVEGSTGLVSLGFERSLVKKSVLYVIQCDQIKPGLFRVIGIEPVRHLLDANFYGRLIRATRADAFKHIASRFDLAFVDKTDGDRGQAHSFVFLSSARSALDQIRLAYKLDRERWHIDLIKEKLFLLPGAIPGDPIEMDMNQFIEENERGVEFEVFPSVCPYLPFIWRDKPMVVDYVSFSKKSNSMHLRLVSND